MEISPDLIGVDDHTMALAESFWTSFFYHMAIYTKKGDKGETGLFSSNPDKKIRVPKSSQIIKTIGAIDEVNSYAGIVISQSEDESLKKILLEIQSDLLTIGSALAGSPLRISKKKVKFFEKNIDKMDAELPLLNNFILPGGTMIASHLQFLRSLIRRAERELVTLSSEAEVKPDILMYINRLSDFVYTLSRYDSFKNNYQDKIWKK